MEGYEGNLATGFQNCVGLADFSEDLAYSHRKMPIRTLPSIHSRGEHHTRMMHKDQGHVLDFMLDRESFARKGQRKLKFPSAVGIVDSSVSGPRLPGQGCNQLTQEIVSAMCLNDRTIVLRITILAAGFVIGPRGSSIKMISDRCNVDIESKTVRNGEVREFKCTGNHKDVVKAVQIMKEAVNTYKILTEGDYKGQCVQSTMVILGITFDYCPPPKSKMPHAASVVKLSQKLASRMEENSSLTTMDSSSSVDSTQGLEPHGSLSDSVYSSKYDLERRSIHELTYTEETYPQSLPNTSFDPWRREGHHFSPAFAERNSGFSKAGEQISDLQHAARRRSAFISPLRTWKSEGACRDGSWGTSKAHKKDDSAAMKNLMRDYGSMDI